MNKHDASIQPEQAFSISMSQTVFEISIAYKKEKKYVVVLLSHNEPCTVYVFSVAYLEFKNLKVS